MRSGLTAGGILRPFEAKFLAPIRPLSWFPNYLLTLLNLLTLVSLLIVVGLLIVVCFPPSLHAASGLPSSEPPQILFEKLSIAGDSSKSDAEWNEFFHSENGILKPSCSYRISFDYKVIARTGNSSFYSLLRGGADQENDTGWQEWIKDAGQSGSVQMNVTTHTAEGYYLIIGIKNKGQIKIENLKIETDPANMPLKLSSGAQKRTWKSPGQTTYYVDSGKGNDDNDGRSINAAWQSLARINCGEFAPGDKILLKAGATWEGVLSPGGKGSPYEPVIVGKYGQGARPRIDGNEKFSNAVLLGNTEFIELRDLEVTNTGSVHQPELAGVRIEENDFGVAHHIVLRNLYVHNVTGSASKRGGGSGINCQIRDKNIPTRFDDLLIEHCHIVDTDRDGITMFGNADRAKWFPNLHVVIQHNLLENIGGDGIVPEGCDGAVLQHNVLKGGRMRADDYAAGIWPWSCDNTLIQYNVVSGMKGTRDGEAYDSDWNCRGSIFQYNFSHDNDGGSMLICDLGSLHMPHNIGNIGTIFRYNVSVNDGLHTFNISGPSQHTQIYNNVIYLGKERKVKAVEVGNWGGAWPEDVCFSNNIFYADHGGTFDFDLKADKSAKSVTFNRNAFWGQMENRPPDVRSLTTDPTLLAPGGLLPHDYAIAAGSPCASAGVKITDESLVDFAGRPVPAASPSIGAFQGSD